MNKIKEKLIYLFDYVDILNEKGYADIAINLQKDINNIIENVNNDYIEDIVKWQIDRNLHIQEFNLDNELTNIIEEILEMIGYDVPKEKRKELTELIKDMLAIIIVKLKLKKNENYNSDNIVDALFDICVFAIGGMLKLKYNPKCVFNEGIKEISSREGKIIDGKFQKDLSKKEEWYTADYSKCKINIEKTK